MKAHQVGRDTSTATPELIRDQVPSIKVLDKAILIVDSLARAVDSRAITDIAYECDLPISTTHRILHTLERSGVAVRDGSSKRFVLGNRWGMVSSGALSDLRRVAYPTMAKLGREVHETILFNGLNTTRSASICIERIESQFDLRLDIKPGSRMPLHVGALQETIAAFMAADELAEVLRGPLTRYTAYTIVDPEQVYTKLERVRKLGYSWVSDETAPGVAGLAVPLLTPEGQAGYSLGIAGPTSRMKHASIDAMLSRLNLAARELAGRAKLQVYVPPMANPSNREGRP